MKPQPNALCTTVYIDARMFVWLMLFLSPVLYVPYILKLDIMRCGYVKPLHNRFMGALLNIFSFGDAAQCGVITSSKDHCWVTPLKGLSDFSLNTPFFSPNTKSISHIPAIHVFVKAPYEPTVHNTSVHSAFTLQL